MGKRTLTGAAIVLAGILLQSAHSQTVEPLPFHAMTSYPYPAGESFPADRIHNRYRQLYNTRPALRLIRPVNP